MQIHSRSGLSNLLLLSILVAIGAALIGLFFFALPVDQSNTQILVIKNRPEMISGPGGNTSTTFVEDYVTTKVTLLRSSSTTTTADEKLKVSGPVDIPMRDGTILRGHIQQPAEGGPYPVLMLRTPYGEAPKYRALAEKGYIVVTSNARGRYSSDGKFELFLRPSTHDAEDGYDTVQWCSKLPNSTGDVGTFGVSYNAFVQWRTSSLRPPALKAMAAFSIPAKHTDLEGPGSFRPARRLQWWFGTIGAEQRRRADRPGSHDKKTADAEYKERHEKLTHTLPWSNLPDDVFEDEKEYILAYLRHPEVDMWKLDEAAGNTSVPNLNVCGWYDHCNSIPLHVAIAKHGHSEVARTGSKLIVGPWAHHALGSRKCGVFDFGPKAALDLNELQTAWFDAHLKGKKERIAEMPPVRIFVMGRNEWRDEKEWPLARAVEQRLYLASAGSANTPKGDGKLVDRPGAVGKDQYTYDPKDPVPSLFDFNGYAICADQNRNASRKDILVYQGEPLKQAIEVTGYPTLELFASSSAPDTDWIVKLVDVAPDGRARDVSTGILRARYREGLEKAKFLTPGETVKYVVRMNATSNEFQPGHRIRVDVTSSDFPSYDRNHNTAVNQNFDAELRIAEQTIHHGGPTPSAIVLPVVGGK